MRTIPGFALDLAHFAELQDLDVLYSKDIEAVIDLTINERPLSLTRELIYCRFPLLDGAGNPPWLLRLAIDTVTSLLKSRTRTVLYCSAGMSRTPCIAAAAIAAIHHGTLAEAIAIVRKSCPCDISPALWSDIQSRTS